MKITKFVHACLLVEFDEKTILIDPGQFSWQSGLFSVGDLSQLDAVVITHEHFDHFYAPFVEAILQKFPEVQFVTTQSVAGKLKELGLENVTTESVPGVEVFSKKQHASLSPLGASPENIAVHVNGQLTVGGDRHDLEESKEVLALTITAPWGSVVDAVQMALKLSPQQIIPVHDWHWNEAARNSEYDRLESFFNEKGIKFHKVVDGRTIQT